MSNSSAEGTRSEVRVYFQSQKLLTHVCTDKYAENSSGWWAESLFRGCDRLASKTSKMILSKFWGSGFAFSPTLRHVKEDAEDEDALTLNFHISSAKVNIQI